jgi:hypothetical protein
MSDEHGTGEQPATPEQSPRLRPQAPLEPSHLDDPWLLDRVLSGDGGDGWSPLAELFAAAAGPAEPDEVDGERDAVESFLAAREAAREAAATGREPARGSGGHGARRVAVVSTLMAGKFAAVTVAGIVTLGAGGMAAAAYTGLLPAPLQDVAHRTIGAPLPERTTLSATASTSPTPTPETTTTTSTKTRTQQSDASTSTTSTAKQPAPSTAELCVDWQQQQLATTDPAFTSLTLAASGSTSIDSFCASLTSPTTEPAPAPQATPTTDPTATPSDTASPTSPPASPSTASDQPVPPPMTASDQPTASPTEPPTTEPTGP